MLKKQVELPSIITMMDNEKKELLLYLKNLKSRGTAKYVYVVVKCNCISHTSISNNRAMTRILNQWSPNPGPLCWYRAAKLQNVYRWWPHSLSGHAAALPDGSNR